MNHFDMSLGDSPRDAIVEILGHIRPHWDKDSMFIKDVKGGNCNRLFACGLPEDVDEDDVLLFRVFGSGRDGIVDGEKEILSMRIGHHVGLCAQIYCIFKNGLACKYQRGCRVDFTNQDNETVARAVAKQLAKLHLTDYESVLRMLGEADKIPMYSSRYRLSGFLPAIMPVLPERHEDPTKEKIRREEFMTKADASAQINRLDDALDKLDFPLVFCHNDLNMGNIVFDERTRSVHFIDWDVANVCYAFHDIGEFFAAHIYTSGVSCDPDQYKHYPSAEYQSKWVRWYMEYKAELCGEDPQLVTESEVQRLCVGANLAAMNWSLIVAQWALLQEITSKVTSDFFSMARHFHGLYWVIKRKIENTESDKECTPHKQTST